MVDEKENLTKEQEFELKKIKIDSTFQMMKSLIAEIRFVDKTLIYGVGAYWSLILTNYKYEIKLPKNGKELYQWSNELRNCLSSYYKSIEKRKTTIYGFFLKNEIKFAVEIRENKIIQVKAKYNNDLNSSEKDFIFSWFDGCF
jgi:hypothetical protein